MAVSAFWGCLTLAIAGAVSTLQKGPWLYQPYNKGIGCISLKGRARYTSARGILGVPLVERFHHGGRFAAGPDFAFFPDEGLFDVVLHYSGGNEPGFPGKVHRVVGLRLYVPE